MTEILEIPEDAKGRIDIFAVDLPQEVMERFVTRTGGTDDPNAAWPLRAALGADFLDPKGIELVGIDDLKGLGLAGYLSEGLGAEDTDLDVHRSALEALEGHVLILRGPAFGGVAQTLSPREPLTHIATLHEVEPAPPGPPLTSESAEPPQEVPEPVDDIPEPQMRKGSGSPMALIVAGLALAVIVVAVLSVTLR